ncbi:hypothetical protein [Sedimentimonas flavescens]|uniref:hypothetical protein n=1 Tax=Sedimentimonas flavescens TaxID=2851012 RepID=UPI0021A36009|nr:hypothetical protein [Sedimentimonas flavescens]MCT2541107.1 hypothetical protein [Sedimentimonas flavescens]
MDAIWREAGHEVRVGKDFDPAADVAILHHNISLIDPALVPPAPKGVYVINGAARDIRKRGYSQLQVSQDTDWNGPVLVKTNDNHFGIPERRIYKSRHVERVWDMLAQWNWKLARRLPYRTYPVLDHVRDVPDWVWRDSAYLVERFVPEREGDLYSIRGWMFLGDRGYGWRIFAHDPMVKTGTMVRYEYLEEAPEEVLAARARCGVDFGKIDYVVHDGRAIVFDVNKTPSFAGDPASPRLRNLALGIEDFLK